MVLGRLWGAAGRPTNRRPAALRLAPTVEVALQSIRLPKKTIKAMTISL